MAGADLPPKALLIRLGDRPFPNLSFLVIIFQKPSLILSCLNNELARIGCRYHCALIALSEPPDFHAPEPSRGCSFNQPASVRRSGLSRHKSKIRAKLNPSLILTLTPTSVRNLATTVLYSKILVVVGLGAELRGCFSWGKSVFRLPTKRHGPSQAFDNPHSPHNPDPKTTRRIP